MVRSAKPLLSQFHFVSPWFWLSKLRTATVGSSRKAGIAESLDPEGSGFDNSARSRGSSFSSSCAARVAISSTAESAGNFTVHAFEARGFHADDPHGHIVAVA